MELNGMLLNLYKDSIMDLVINSLYETFHQILIKSINETNDIQETMYCMCFFNDLLEYSRLEVPNIFINN